WGGWSPARGRGGGWGSEYTWWRGLVEEGPVGRGAAMVKARGVVPLNEPEGLGSAKVSVVPEPAVPGCRHAPLSPAIRRQTVAGSTPARPLMLAETDKGGPAVSKNARPFRSV